MKGIGCPVCGTALSVRLARGRKSQKAFVFLRCPTEGRHFRAFISDRTFVEHVIAAGEVKLVNDSKSEKPTGTAGRG